MNKKIVLLSGLFLSSSFYCELYANDAFIVKQDPDKITVLNGVVEQQPDHKTIVIQESNTQDQDIQDQLDALLNEFIAEMDLKKQEYSFVSSQVISSAFDFYGVRYRFGGNSSSGIDCSGLVINAFSDTTVDLPRRSLDMAKVGQKVSKSQAQKGDLIFFKTRGARISHVGIITEVSQDEIKFIHSSTSKGVIVSSTKENYYRSRFVQINRVLDVNI